MDTKRKVGGDFFWLLQASNLEESKATNKMEQELYVA